MSPITRSRWLAKTGGRGLLQVALFAACVLAWTALPALPAAPRPGQLRLTSGAVVVGEMSLVDGAVEAKPATGNPLRLPLAEVAELRFADLSPEGVGESARAVTGTAGSAPATNAPAVPATTRRDGLPPAGSSAAPTAEWSTSNVGTAAFGRVESAGGGWRVLGTGVGLRGNADSVFFAERRLDAAGQVVARLESFDGQDPESVAGLMLRDNLGDSAAYGFLGLRTGSGLCFQYRQVASGMTMRVTNLNATLPIWLRLSRSGGAVVAESSPDGLAWQVLGRGNINLGQMARAGVAVASGQTNLTNTLVLREPIVGAKGLGYSPSSGFPRLWLRGGSKLVGSIESADDAVVRLGAPFRGGLVSVLNLARIEFAPLSSELVGRLEPDRPGVLMTDGDFVDGQLRSMATNTVTVSSLLFGFRRFQAGSEVAAVQFGEVAPEDVGYRLELNNGSELLVRKLTVSPTTIRAEAPKLGTIDFALGDLRSLRRAGTER